jgi:hypothetical protein
MLKPDPVLKQILLYSSIAAALILLGYFTYQLLQEESDNVDAIAVVSDNVQVLISLERISFWPDQKDWMESTLKHPMNAPAADIWHRWQIFNNALFQLHESSPQWSQALQNSNIVFAGSHIQSADHWVHVFVLDGQSLGVKDWVHQFGASSDQRNYKEFTIYTNGDLAFTQIGSAIISSLSVAAIEGSILAHLNGHTMIQHTAFMQAYEVRSSESAQHYFAMYNPNEWIQLERAESDSGPAYIGVLFPTDSSLQTTHLHGVNSSDLAIPSWLPQGTYFWDAFQFDRSEDLMSVIEDHYADTPRAQFWQSAWQIFGDSCACDLNEALIAWRDGRCGVVAWDINDSTSGEVYYIGHNDTLPIAARMPRSLLKKLPTAAPIYQIQMPMLFDRHMVSSIHIEPNYLMEVDQALLLSHSLEDLHAIYTAQLGSSPLLKNICKEAPASRMTYASGASGHSTLPSTLQGLLFYGNEYVITYSEAAAGRTLVSIYTKSLAQTTTAIGQNETTSDTLTTASRQWRMINHLTSDQETLEELSNYHLRLKDAGGKILWTVSKDQPVLGDVIQIDALKNGKLQMAYTTATGMYVLDRNGATYTPLCITMPKTVTSALGIFDYEMNKNYRLVFATEDGIVHNYNAMGTATTGWKYEPHGVIQKFQHFKQGTEDCLLMIDLEGQMYLHKRNGQTRQEVCNKLDKYAIQNGSLVVGANIYQTRWQWLDSTDMKQFQKIVLASE